MQIKKVLEFFDNIIRLSYIDYSKVHYSHFQILKKD